MMIMGMPAGTFAIVALAVVALLLLALIPARVAQGKRAIREGRDIIP